MELRQYGAGSWCIYVCLRLEIRIYFYIMYRITHIAELFNDTISNTCCMYRCLVFSAHRLYSVYWIYRLCTVWLKCRKPIGFLCRFCCYTSQWIFIDIRLYVDCIWSILQYGTSYMYLSRIYNIKIGLTV